MKPLLLVSIATLSAMAYTFTASAAGPIELPPEPVRVPDIQVQTQMTIDTSRLSTPTIQATPNLSPTVNSYPVLNAATPANAVPATTGGNGGEGGEGGEEMNHLAHLLGECIEHHYAQEHDGFCSSLPETSDQLSTILLDCHPYCGWSFAQLVKALQRSRFYIDLPLDRNQRYQSVRSLKTAIHADMDYMASVAEKQEQPCRGTADGVSGGALHSLRDTANQYVDDRLGDQTAAARIDVSVLFDSAAEELATDTKACR